MKLCPDCGSPEHPSWKAHVFVNTNKPSVNTLKKLVEPVNTALPSRRWLRGDRHAEGYMRGYMAVRRAVKSGRACRWPRESRG